MDHHSYSSPHIAHYRTGGHFPEIVRVMGLCRSRMFVAPLINRFTHSPKPDLLRLITVRDIIDCQYGTFFRGVSQLLFQKIQQPVKGLSLQVALSHINSPRMIIAGIYLYIKSPYTGIELRPDIKSLVCLHYSAVCIIALGFRRVGAIRI